MFARSTMDSRLDRPGRGGEKFCWPGQGPRHEQLRDANLLLALPDVCTIGCMGRVRFDSFDWDEGNRAKCQKHGVSIVEIEQALSVIRFVVPDPSTAEPRYRTVGLTDEGRHVFAVFTLRDLKLRPISARFMHRKEIASYEEAMARLEER